LDIIANVARDEGVCKRNGEVPKRGFLYTYSGRIALPDGAPTLLDIAVALSRECRYAGNGMRWWPVSLHCLCVADLLPDSLKLHGLMHDAAECITGDVPKPVKTDEIEAFEDMVQARIYESLKLTPPTAEEWCIIKQADMDVMRGEVYTVGTPALQEVYSRCPDAEALVIKYAAEYPPMECICPDGRAPIEFLRRYRVYRDLL